MEIAKIRYFFLDLLLGAPNFNKGDSIPIYVTYNRDANKTWEYTLTYEDEFSDKPWSLTGTCKDSNATFGRRYHDIYKVIGAFLDNFNENANIKNHF